MKIAIMQPYFFPYIGYFQLIAEADTFVVYDNIQYTKKGWINRNRILQNGKGVLFTIPLKKASDYLDVCERELSGDFNRKKLLNQITGAYRRAPYFKQTFPLIEQIVQFEDPNLFSYLHYSIFSICKYLGIKTEIKTSSDIDIDHKLKGQDKVLAICETLGADSYVNAIGGVELYSKDIFKAKGIDLNFIRSKPIEYPQFGAEFAPMLSMIDTMMFNSLEIIQKQITQYDLV
ncbi:MAG: WbqC family protein [Halobacteriovoraceae bacterium]|jgi:hypothetical protein|nr:WbqC family protein [Halobacteriovoraceae bacterium]